MMKMLSNNINNKIYKISFKMQKLYQNQQQTQEVLNKHKIQKMRKYNCYKN